MHTLHLTGTSTKLTATLHGEADTLALGARLGQCVHGGMLIELRGELGAGKTTLVRGLLRGQGFAGRVKSPTYTLVELYVISSLYFYHFDLYRFDNPMEWEEAGFRDDFRPDSVCLVEWPDKAAGLLPAADIQLQLTHRDDSRELELVACTEAGRCCLQCLMTPPTG